MPSPPTRRRGRPPLKLEALATTPGLELLSCRHCLEVLVQLASRPALRLRELRQLQDSPGSRLALNRLRQLEAAGWVERVIAAAPRTTSYRLTAAAEPARPALLQLARTAESLAAGLGTAESRAAGLGTAESRAAGLGTDTAPAPREAAVEAAWSAQAG